VKKIYNVLKKTEDFIAEQYPQIPKFLPEDIFFITTQELEDMYPELLRRRERMQLQRRKSDISHENRRCSQIREET